MHYRLATENDAEVLLAIYSQYIETAITFECQLPSVEEFRQRIHDVLLFYPYLVAEDNGRIVGYAYAHRHMQREAYQWNAELSKNLFKDKLTIKAKIYDILKDSQNSSRTTTDNYIEDLENNTLGQYMMFSVVWRFGNFGGGKMMGPHRGPGGRPGPPPPRR